MKNYDYSDEPTEEELLMICDVMWEVVSKQLSYTDEIRMLAARTWFKINKHLNETKKKKEMIVKNLLLAKPLDSYTPEEFITYVKSIVMRTESKASKSVDEITLTFGPRTIVRVKRDPKYITSHEIERLAKEYKKEVSELNALFRSRKIEIRE